MFPMMLHITTMGAINDCCMQVLNYTSSIHGKGKTNLNYTSSINKNDSTNLNYTGSIYA